MRAGSRTSSAVSRAVLPPPRPIHRAAAASLGNVQVSIAAEVAVTYMELCALELRLAIARDNLASQEETLQIAQWRAQAGLTTSLDVEQARTSTEQTRAQIPALAASIAQARSSLAVLAGATPEAMQSSLRVSAVVPTADDALALAFPAETLRQRPDVRQAEYQVSAAASRVTQADAARYPTFRLGGTLGLAALTLGGLTGGGALVDRVAGLGLGADLRWRRAHRAGARAGSGARPGARRLRGGGADAH